MARRHVDKYRGPASEPHKHRGHFRGDGIAKRGYSEADAKDLAERITKDPRRPDQSAYPCDLCPAWHIGRTR